MSRNKVINLEEHITVDKDRATLVIDVDDEWISAVLTQVVGW